MTHAGMRNGRRHVGSRPALCGMVLGALALGGCGGGSASPVSPPVYNMSTGLGNLLSSGLSANVSLNGTVIVNGASVAFSGTGSVNFAAAPSSATVTFNGVSARGQAETISGTVTAAGQSAPYSTSVTDYYAAGNLAYLGETSSGEYDLTQTPMAWPTVVAAGDSGTLATVSRYTDSTMSVSLGTTQVSYMVKADSANGSDVIVEIKDLIYDSTNTLTETDVTDFALSAGNVMSLVSASVQANSGTLNVTPQ